MYSRLLQPSKDKSFFLFGPRGTGKSTWVRQQFSESVYLDLLDSSLYTGLLADPSRLQRFIPKDYQGWIVIDEVQRIPALLNEVHRLIETQKLRFVLTGSSARSLRKRGVNLLAGRALTHYLYPLTSSELGSDFDLATYLRYGGLPSVFQEASPQAYLDSYVTTYLREEVQQEGLTRNLGAFARFLEAASFSQGQVLNVAAVSRECAVERKVVENYFSILTDLLLSYRLPVFTKKAKRTLITHQKFYFFDVGVYRTVRPRGPLDAAGEIDGPALETFFLQELLAANAYQQLGYAISYWRTRTGSEVDFVLYGERGLKAFEVKLAEKVRMADLQGLRAFLADYPMAQGYLVYCGERVLQEGEIVALPIRQCVQRLPELLAT
jgi:predicted AAA+ superfamily ATPase